MSSDVARTPFMTAKFFVPMLLLAGAAAMVLQLTDRKPCLIVETSPYRCMDDRLTAEARAHVVRIEEDPGIPTWVVSFVVNGQQVTGRIRDWPAANAPKAGDATTVAYDPQSPITRVTSAAGLADYRARAARSGGFSFGKWALRTVGFAVCWSVPAMWVGRRWQRRQTA